MRLCVPKRVSDFEHVCYKISSWSTFKGQCRLFFNSFSTVKGFELPKPLKGLSHVSTIWGLMCSLWTLNVWWFLLYFTAISFVRKNLGFPFCLLLWTSASLKLKLGDPALNQHSTGMSTYSVHIATYYWLTALHLVYVHFNFFSRIQTPGNKIIHKTTKAPVAASRKFSGPPNLGQSDWPTVGTPPRWGRSQRAP